MNQFSESLLTLSHDPDICFLWSEMDHKIGLFTSCKLMRELPQTDHYMSNIYEMKATFLCFIIAMSDQDLFECFGIPLPSGLFTKYI